MNLIRQGYYKEMPYAEDTDPLYSGFHRKG